MGQRVLIVDDTEHVREMLEAMLELDGFDVVGAAASGEDAIPLAVEKQPDVIVMDYKMPGMDGLAASRRSGRPVPTSRSSCTPHISMKPSKPKPRKPGSPCASGRSKA